MSAKIADAEYIAQVQMENLVNRDYIDLVTGGHATATRVPSGNYEYTIELKPWGIDFPGGTSGNTVVYMHVIPYQITVSGIMQTNVVAFFPDGSFISADNIGNTIRLDETSDGFYFYVINASTGIVSDASGSLEDAEDIAVIGNTTLFDDADPNDGQDDVDPIYFNFNPISKITFIMTSESKNYSFIGTGNPPLEYRGTDKFLNFLVRATINVYYKGDTEPLTTMTDTLYPAFVRP
jgi:hypothetical protein